MHPPDDVQDPQQGLYPATDPITRPAFLSAQQFGTVVGLSRRTVLRRIRDGRIRATRIGRLWRIPAAEIGRLLG